MYANERPGFLHAEKRHSNAPQKMQEKLPNHIKFALNDWKSGGGIFHPSLQNNLYSGGQPIRFLSPLSTR